MQSNGSILTNPNKIKGEFLSYYRSLYSEQVVPRREDLGKLLDLIVDGLTVE